MKTPTPTTTPPDHDPELALLIERHLDADVDATRDLDTRLANDPEAALAFARAHRMDALLGAHHQMTRQGTRVSEFVRPLVWMAAAATIALLAWVAVQQGRNPSPVITDDIPQKTSAEEAGVGTLFPQETNGDMEPSGVAALKAADLQRKAWNFFLPSIDVSNAEPNEALNRVRETFRSIATRHGDIAARGVLFEFVDSGTPPVTVNLKVENAPLVAALSGIALQSGAELRIADGRISIIREPFPADDDTPYRDSLGISSLGAQLLGYGPPPPSDEADPDDPFRVPVLDAEIASVSFHNASISEVVDELTLKSRDLDPEKRGLNFVVKIPRAAAANDSRFTMSGNDIPIRRVLQSLVDDMGLKFVEESHAVVIALKNDLSVGPEPFRFEIAGLIGQYDALSGRVVLQGNKTLVERTAATLRALESGSRGDSTDDALVVTTRTIQQVLITAKIFGYRAETFVASGGSKEFAADLPLPEGILTADRKPDDMLRALAESSDTRVFSSPSVVTRADQRAKIEIIREIIYQVPGENGEMAFEMAPAGWTLESNPTFIGEAVHLQGVLSYGGLSESPDLETMMSPEPVPNDSAASAAKGKYPIGNPVHVQELEFDVELLTGQAALLEFMRLDDGHRVVALIRAERIDPSGQRVFPLPSDYESR